MSSARALINTTNFDTKTENQLVIVTISGPVDENTEFPDLSKAARGVLRLELNAVTRLNSMGLKGWIAWMKSIPKNLQVEFSLCPRAVVDQMGILNGFLPMQATVVSFLVPYHCHKCGHETDVIAIREQDYLEANTDFREKVLLSAERPCPECGSQMDWDIVPQKYFSFMRRRR